LLLSMCARTRLFLLILLSLLLWPRSLRAEMRIPAFTAYLEPDTQDATVSERRGITRWTNSAVSVNWFGEIRETAEIRCALSGRAAEGTKARFKLIVEGVSQELTLQGKGTNVVTSDYVTVRIREAGYQRFRLELAESAGAEIDALVLEGADNAHFNLKPRRNAASVHLFYPLPAKSEAQAFYCELTGLEDPIWTYYMACGWHRGYFGMQVNSATERRIIFSVWDSGSEAKDRGKTKLEDRVQLKAKGEGVFAGDFGNEGTGGHSHLKFNWKTGERQKFVVTALPTDATHTVFSGYYLRPDTGRWMLISSWIAPKEGGHMRGLYSFSENFGGANGQLQRKALYGNQWAQLASGDWIELTKARFSHDPTGKTDRLDRYMGLENGEFFLSQGGFVAGFTKYGEEFTRGAVGRRPKLELPSIP
jgi:hypothetical protein